MAAHNHPNQEPRSLLFAYACKILLLRPYFSCQLQNKLLLRAKKLGIDQPDSQISSIISDLSASGYIDDRYLAQSFVRRQLGKSYGPRIIALKLRALGLPAGEISSAIESQATNEAIVDSIRHYHSKHPKIDKRKILTSLYARGFPGHLIRQVFDVDINGD